MKRVKTLPLLPGEVELIPPGQEEGVINRFEDEGFKNPYWTDNKAALIAKYLKLFVAITHHGIYLDGFAGPQEPGREGSWAAKLVTDIKLITHFAFFEKSRKKLTHLKDLIKNLPPSGQKRGPYLHLRPGDMNAELPKYLTEHPIRPSRAAFCLLDQHTFECDWETVRTVAAHKSTGRKIEIFYFLAQGWLERAVAGCKRDKDKKLEKWWGNPGWKHLMDVPYYDRGKFLSQRFKDELGYKFSKGFPIFERHQGQGKVMFWMVHASDHHEAIPLMIRAYNGEVASLSPYEDGHMPFYDENLKGELSQLYSPRPG